MTVPCRACNNAIEGSLRGKCRNCGAQFRLGYVAQGILIAISMISAFLGFSLLSSSLPFFVQIIGCLTLVAGDVFLSITLALRAPKFWRNASRSVWEVA